MWALALLIFKSAVYQYTSVGSESNGTARDTSG